MTTDLGQWRSSWIVPPDIQVFSTPGNFTWIAPVTSNVPMSVYVFVVSGGGGGASGSSGGSTAARTGGGGGGGGTVMSATLLPADLGVSVDGHVGAGGTGGVAVTGASAGNDGTYGAGSSLASRVRSCCTPTAAARGWRPGRAARPGSG